MNNLMIFLRGFTIMIAIIPFVIYMLEYESIEDFVNKNILTKIVFKWYPLTVVSLFILFIFICGIYSIGLLFS